MWSYPQWLTHITSICQFFHFVNTRCCSTLLFSWKTEVWASSVRMHGHKCATLRWFCFISREIKGSRRFNKKKPSEKLVPLMELQFSHLIRAQRIHSHHFTNHIVLGQILGLICCLCVCPPAAIHSGDLWQLEGQDLPEVHWEVGQRSWRVWALSWTVCKRITKSTFSLSPPHPKVTNLLVSANGKTWSSTSMWVHISVCVSTESDQETLAVHSVMCGTKRGY